MRKHLAVLLSVTGLAGTALAENKPAANKDGSKSKDSKLTVKQEAVRDQNTSVKETKEMNKTEGAKGNAAVTKGKAGDSKTKNAEVTKR